jgi:cytochrome o ubiquinol oxidase subunit II
MIPGAVRFAGALLAIVASEPTLAAGVLSPKGPIGAAEKTILIDSLAIMLSIVVPTIIATLAFAWWFRASNVRARRRPNWEFSGEIELVVWSIPLMTIILLGGVAWIGSYQLDPAERIASKTPAVEVQVVSLDWKWLFIYPQQGIASINELVVPTSTPVHFSLTSASVMNAFFIPELGSMIYTMNGMVTQLNLQADEPGTYAGRSAHFSGDGFSDMHFATRAVSQAEFLRWIADVREGGNTLDANAYTALAQQSVPAAPARFGSVDATLFHRIAMLEIAPGPGPESVPEGRSVPPPSGGP